MKKPNIILIVIDACRARNLGCYGYDRPTSPFIDAIARESAVFSHCYSTINMTDPSFTTILSGNYPATHGMIEHGITSAAVYSEILAGLVPLPAILRENGYYTIGVDWLGRWHAQGFDTYSGSVKKRMKFIDEGTFDRIKKIKPVNTLIDYLKSKTRRGLFNPFYLAYDPAKNVTDYALETVKARKSGNFFLFMHYWDAHMPYKPPGAHVTPFTGRPYDVGVKDIGEILAGLENDDWRNFIRDFTGKMKSTDEALARYDGGIHYVDSEIGRLLKGLKTQGVMDNTLLIITADHGESLTEHDIFFAHHGLYDELVHVPLIMRFPGSFSARRLDQDIQHIDIVPTILDLAGIEYSGNRFDGKSLSPLLNGKDEGKSLHPFLFFEETRTERKFAIKMGKYKYIYALSEKDARCKYCGRVHGGVEELFDLEKDPGEAHNIAGANPALRNELREKALSFRDGLGKKRGRQGLEQKIQKIRINKRP